MTGGPATSEEATEETVDEAPVTIHWWREIAIVIGFYGIYTLVRNEFGSASVSAAHAFDNALRVIDVERALGLFHEATIQGWFLDDPLVLRSFNIFYGSLHFIVTAGALIWLAWRHPRAYPVWRNTLLIATAVALVGFSLFPLMPPRLLCDCPYGAGPAVASEDLPQFVDTLAVHDGLWSFDDSTMQAVSNQYAAMPSLHFAWALWCALVIVPRARHRWAKALAALYPAVTLLAIIVTGNHFWLDAAGGALVVGVGWVLGSQLAAVTRKHRRRADTVAATASASPSAPPPPAGPDHPPSRPGKEAAAP